MDAFGFIVCNLPDDAADLGVVIAAAGCGATGVLNCAGMDPGAVRQALARIQQSAQGPFGVKLDANSLHLLPVCNELRRSGSSSYPHAFVEVSSPDEAARARELGCDGVIARGMALAGQLAASTRSPVWIAGIGPDSVMACHAAGIAGVVIE